MFELVAKGLRVWLLAVCALATGTLIAVAQTAPSTSSLEGASSQASRYSILSDALWGMGLDDLPERLDTAGAALAAHPDSAEAHLRMGLAISLANPRAVSLIKLQYEEALRLDPKMPRAYALMGELLSAEDDAESTERNYRAWLAFAPDDPKAHLSYAVALARLGQRPEAVVELDRSLALGPTSAAYFSRAIASRDGPREAVLADFDRALAVGGSEAGIYRWRARLRWEWGETDLALADVAKALEYAPDSFRLRQLRAEINGSAERYTLALAEFDTLIALHPGWPDLTNDRCWARAMAGVELHEALADCDAVVEWEPDRPEGFDSRGLVRLRLGDLPGAIADYDAALKQDPAMATSLFGRGVAKRRRGDKTGGDADLVAARSLEPGIDKRFESFGVTP
jgi:tetratricopeptide (TPR) repeat protein